jgi:hypothetical protein
MHVNRQAAEKRSGGQIGTGTEALKLIEAKALVLSLRG